MASGTYDKAAQDLADQWAEEGIDVMVAAFPWAVLRQNNTNDLLSGAGQYDVMSGGGYLADVFRYFAPVDEFVARDNFGEGLIPGLMEPGRAWFYEGKQIGVPYGIDAYGLLYRTDIFEEAGIEPSFPTFAEFVTAAQKLQDHLEGSDIAPYVFAYGDPQQHTNIFYGEYGGTYINKEGKFELETDEAVRALNVMLDMLPYGPSNMMGLSIEEANAVFLDGRAAMMPCWPSFVRAAADDPDQSKVVGKWAQMTYPGKGTPYLSLWNLFIAKTAKDKELAWQWVRDFTSEENDRHMLETYGIGSVWESTYSDPDVMAKHGHDFGAAFENFKRSWPERLSSEAGDYVCAVIGEVLIEEVDPDAGVKKINDALAKLIVPDSIMMVDTAAGFVAK